jgi:hypothetical protein
MTRVFVLYGSLAFEVSALEVFARGPNALHPAARAVLESPGITGVITLGGTALEGCDEGVA